MEIVAEQILILFIIAAVGFIAMKAKVLTKEGNAGLVKLILKITLPLLILTTFSNTELSSEILLSLPFVAATAFCSIMILFGLGKISAKLQKLDKENTALHSVSTMFGNVAFLGFPLLNAVFPNGEGLIYASIFQLSHDTILWTFGLFTLKKASTKNSEKSWKHIINPATISLIIGLFLFLFQIKLPQIIYNPLHGIGNSTIYLSMIYIGAILSTVKIKKILLNFRSYILCFNKLILCPIIIILIFVSLKNFGLKISEKALISSILETATPCMIIVSILAEELGLNSKQSVENIFISSILSIITLPFIYWLANKMIIF